MTAIVQAQQSYDEIVARLNRASVAKHHDAYVDVHWEDPALRLDPADPRWELPADDPLGATCWYQTRPATERARIGLAFTAYRMRRGMEFENVLARGLLEFALTRPSGSPDFRYAYHELIEEAQHSLMFQEFVDRSRCQIAPLSGFHRFFAARVPPLGRRFPQLFFVYVLAGELPIDQTQRALLARGDAVHPLHRRITQIHISEEARHVCFAQQYLGAHLPRLGRAARLQLQWMAPFVSVESTRIMLAPPRSFTRPQGIPDRVMATVYASRLHRELMAAAIQPLYDTFVDLGVVSPASEGLWQRLALGSAQHTQKALPSPRAGQLS